MRGIKNKKIEIYVCFHDESLISMVLKKIKNNKIYIPLLLGNSEQKSFDFLTDSEGDNISNEHIYLAELTGLYWMWKNSDADIIGLCHYRRYLKNDNGKLLTEKDIKNYLKSYDILMPKKTNLIKGSLYETYDGEYNIDVLNQSREIISRLYPEYLDVYDEVMGQDSFSCYNIFVTSKKITSDYCGWLFPIVKELEKSIDLNIKKRIIGITCEYLFNVWIKYQNFNVKELNLSYVGNSLKFRMYISNNKFFRKFYLKLIKNDKLKKYILNYFY